MGGLHNLSHYWATLRRNGALNRIYNRPPGRTAQHSSCTLYYSTHSQQQQQQQQKRFLFPLLIFSFSSFRSFLFFFFFFVSVVRYWIKCQRSCAVRLADHLQLTEREKKKKKKSRHRCHRRGIPFKKNENEIDRTLTYRRRCSSLSLVSPYKVKRGRGGENIQLVQSVTKTSHVLLLLLLLVPPRAETSRVVHYFLTSHSQL